MLTSRKERGPHLPFFEFNNPPKKGEDELGFTHARCSICQKPIKARRMRDSQQAYLRAAISSCDHIKPGDKEAL